MYNFFLRNYYYGQVSLVPKDINLCTSPVNFRNRVSFVQYFHCILKSYLVWCACVLYRSVRGKLMKTVYVSDLLVGLESVSWESNMAVLKLNLRYKCKIIVKKVTGHLHFLKQF